MSRHGLGRGVLRPDTAGAFLEVRRQPPAPELAAGIFGPEADEVGRRVSPGVPHAEGQGRVLRRARLHEAAARAGEGAGIGWAALAADLGYADQAHLTRDFAAAVGTPPGRYAGR